jgi:hypothetical protein
MSNVKIFSQTSNTPYTRHRYKFVYSNGTYKVFDHYEDVQMEWMQVPFDMLGTIEVLDKKDSKGFG